MKAECLNGTNFQGKFIVANNLSNKPKRCLNKVQNNIQKLVQKKDYNLYLKQDYAENLINIIADYPFPLKPYQRTPLFVRTQMSIPITSKASKYVDTASNVINQFENNIRDKEQKNWEQERKKQKEQEIRDIAETIIYSPFFIAEALLHEINPKWANKFENLLQKIGI